MKTKFLTALLISLVCITMLTSCGHTHTWIDADCTNPLTCSECKETEGEALGHSFTEATCLAPETCNLCGITQGEALEHQLSDATYHSPAICSVCSTQIGDALTPDFEAYGIKADLKVGSTYDYRTLNGNGSQTTVGKTTVSSYDIIDSDDIRQAREGYKWHVVTFDTLFSDPVATQTGANIDYCYSNYYDIKGFADSADHSDEVLSAFTVNYNGKEEKVYLGQAGSFEDNGNGTFTFTFTISVHAPVGYDGVVVGLNNSAIDARRSGKYLNEVYSEGDFLLFRLNGEK
ncbi:MAG: hypothetical protein E7635_01775 [Ruminococcaceae bacterium]|nr:hypothetical protein [Oscillospiraceae bacterium]